MGQERARERHTLVVSKRNEASKSMRSFRPIVGQIKPRKPRGEYQELQFGDLMNESVAFIEVLGGVVLLKFNAKSQSFFFKQS